MSSTLLPFFSFIIDAIPPHKKAEATEQYESLISSLDDANDTEVSKALIRFGKQFWGDIQAFHDLYEQYGAPKALSYIAASLTGDMHSRWQSLATNAQSPHDVLSQDAYEATFTEEEDQFIQQSWLQARDSARSYVQGLIEGDQAEHYADLVRSYAESVMHIEKLVVELRALKETGDKWDEEIERVIEDIERGFGFMEQTPTVEKVHESLEWYKGQIGVGNA